MRQTVILLVLACLALFGSSQAVLSVKLYELRLHVQQQQAMNYEFSSDLLQIQFREMLNHSENHKAEINRLSLSNTILTGKLAVEGRIGLLERVGLQIANVLRIMSLKPILSLENDQSLLIKLQYAFLLERNQRCDLAALKYENLILEIREGELPFVLLHAGFCRAISGEKELAIKHLTAVVNEHGGTPFAKDARSLLLIVRESEIIEGDIRKSFSDPAQVAAELFKRGQHAATVRELERKKDLSDNDRYIRAYSLEKIGQTEKATQEYKNLSMKALSPEIARQANRRLLIVARVYGGGEKMAQFAEGQAILLNDTKAAEEINVAAKNVQSPLIEQLSSLQNSEVNSEIIGELKETLPGVAEIVAERKFNKEKSEKSTVVKNEESAKIPPKSEIKKAAGVSKDLVSVHLVDGRTYLVQEAVIGDGTLILRGQTNLEIPQVLVERIQAQNRSKSLLIHHMGGLLRTSSIASDDGELMVRDQSNEFGRTIGTYTRGRISVQ